MGFAIRWNHLSSRVRFVLCGIGIGADNNSALEVAI
jgi:hypothetical protein